MNLFEKSIAFFDPKIALKRAFARQSLEKIRSYDAASKGRRTSGWHGVGTSANAENQNLFELRNRSRELRRNNAYTKSAIDVIATNVIGAGIIPEPRAKDVEKKRIKAAWKDWAETTECDYNGRLNFYGLQKLATEAVAESGGVIWLKRKVKTSISKIGIQIQVLEIDYLDWHKTVTLLENGGYIIQGVEFDKSDKRVAYWMYEQHPGDIINLKSLVSKRVVESEVIHIFKQDRPGQVNGVPFGVSVFIKLRDFAEYEDAQLVSQKMAACFSIFVQDSSPETLATGNGAVPLMSESVQPGIIQTVPSGKTITFATPPQPQQTSEYSRKILQAIAGGYGITYEALTGDLSNVNFSSGRMGWLEAHRKVTDLQYNVVIPPCDGVWSWFMSASFIAGLVPNENTKADWTPPRREMIDPVKETTGITNQVRAGILTPSEAARQQGYDFDDLVTQYQADLAKLDKAGIILDTDMRHQVQQTVDAPKPGAKDS